MLIGDRETPLLRPPEVAAGADCNVVWPHAPGTATIAALSASPPGLPSCRSKNTSWFNEQHDYSGSSIGFRVKQRLHAEQTPFQAIEIYESTDWGNVMVIDGCMMVTTRDNFLYHEMMSAPGALFTHARAESASSSSAAATCGTLRHEVLKHDEVESAIQVRRSMSA